ncbi:acyltransferase family protein [Elongatibacter sediminis]|uniref:Acyltransferase n=1 Tax=Elongatibacter sediminis TaxID=3119006 RepID=A0AAW9R6F2_9GAMM
MLINIQFLRFAAAMLVVLYHASSHLADSGAKPGFFFQAAEAVGFAGVDIFFVISGYIMAHTTARASGVTPGLAFLRRRIARIYSGYWPFFLLALVVFWWINPDHLAQSSLVRSAVLWPANHLLIAVSWTLIFEMFFYILYTVLITTGLHRLRHLLATLTVLMAAFALYSQFVRHAYDPGQLETISLAEYYMLSPYLLEFLGGALLARYNANRKAGAGWQTVVLGIVVFGAGGWINLAGFQGHIEQGYYVFYRVAVFGTASLLIVAGVVGLEARGFMAPRRFSLQAGGASYAIYLSHTLFLAATQYLGLNRWLRGQDDGFAQWIFLLYAGFILVHGIVHYRWIERPLHQQFRRVLGVGRRQPAASSEITSSA